MKIKAAVALEFKNCSLLFGEKFVLRISDQENNLGLP